MNNKIARKITSLTLMTIMLAGGMTVAFPGFTPDAYAANANLLVSAENTGGYVDGPQVIEILVIDEDLASTALPDVTVNGDAVVMTRTNDGNWYAYIANDASVAAISGTTEAQTANPGLNFGTTNGCTDLPGSDAADRYCANAVDNAVRSAKSPFTADSNWPFIQTYEFSSTIKIQYNKAGGAQITTLEFDDNAPGLFLDRTTYPPGATVHAIINDHRLNIDPTSADIWTWNITSPTSQQKYYGGQAVIGIETDANIDPNTAVSAVCDGCNVIIDANRQNSGPDVINIAAIPGRSLPYAAAVVDNLDTLVDETVAATAWFTVREIGGPNAGIFATTTLAEDSILTIADDAARGSSASITYDDNDVTGIQVQHSTATIEIQSPDGVWTSGSAVPIVIVDGDNNKNSRADDDLSVSDINSIVPTLVTGDPFTLSEVSDEIVIWIGVRLNMNVDDVEDEYDRLISSSQGVDDSAKLQYSHDTYDDENVMFRLGGVENIDPADPSKGVIDKTPNNIDNTAEVNAALNGDNVVGIRSASTIEEFSNRGIVKLIPSSDERYTDEVLESLKKLGILNVDEIDANILVFDIADNIVELQDSLIDTSSDSNDIGFNMINYNFDVFEDAVPQLLLTIVDHKFLGGIGNQTLLGSTSGYTEFSRESGTVVTDLISDYDDGDGFVQLAVNYGPNKILLKSGEEYPVILDIFSFGFRNNGEASDERIANQIIRFELEENGSDTGSLEGSLEYIMINQLNIDDLETYQGLTTIGNEVSFIVIEDLTGSSAPSVTYLDVDINGAQVQVSAQEDAPSHSAVVSLAVESFKAGDTVTVTLEDLDLNVDSGLVDIYTVVNTIYLEETVDGTTTYTSIDEDDITDDNRNTVVTDVNYDAVGEAYGAPEYDGVELGRLLEITFDDERWMDHSTTDARGNTCTDLLIDQDEQYNLGLGDTNFSLFETGDATGIFVGTFPIPAEFCKAGIAQPESVTGLDIEVNYVDFRDQSGETTEVGDSAGVKASTGSVSLDRTVYPVPFGIPDDFNVFNEVSTPADGNTDTRSVFPIHQSGMGGEGIAEPEDPGLTAGEFLPQGDLIVYVTITDPDFDVSASGRDSIAIPTCFELSNGWKEDHPEDRRNNECRENGGADNPVGFTVEVDRAPVTISVLRGSEEIVVDRIGGADSPIDEIAPGAGIFEKSVTLTYEDGPESSLCPESEVDAYPDEDGDRNEANCILQGDILTVEYRDPTDASGQPNTVTDSATFDLRNGVLQSDKSVYIIGSDMILTLIEPDLDLDSSQDETYDLDLIKWSSSAATLTMGDADGQISEFDPEPLSFRETGPSTGIFQIVIEIPQELDGDSLQRGEEIDLEYTDWGPSGADYVGDQDEDIRLTVFTSNFGATIDLDQKVYSWTDKVYITVVAPDHNFDDNLIDEIGESDEDPLRVATKGFDLDNYRLVETGFDTGIFTGEVILTGFGHDPTGDGIEIQPRTGGAGPTDGFLQTPSDGGISVSYEFSEDETVFTSSIIRWNIGDVQWLEASYPASGTGVLRVIDPDMNLNPEAVDNFDVNVASNTDASGITLTVTETNEATGIFEGTVFFTTTGGSSGHRLRVSEGDTVTADYADGTLPLPYTVNDSVSITSTTIIGTFVPPLDRAPASNLRIVNTFGNSIDTVSVDQQVQITTDLSNGQDRDQDFAYLIQIQDSEGVTVSLSWIAGSLSPGQSFSPSASWTPTSTGTYDVTAFVWESIDNPTALSPPRSIDISVN